MSGRSLVEVLAPTLLKETELNHLVAHHVGIRCKSGTHRTQRVFHDVFPILLMQRNDFQRQAILMRNARTHFNVFFSGAITFPVVHTDADIEQSQVMPFLFQFVYNHGAVNAAGNQYGYIHFL